MAHHDGLRWSPRSLRRALLVGSAIGIIVLAACTAGGRRAQSPDRLGARSATSR
jgi:hypothetical protein